MPTDILPDADCIAAHCIDQMAADIRDLVEFRNRLTMPQAARFLRIKQQELRAAVEQGLIDYIDVSGTGSGTGKNMSVRFTYSALAKFARTYRLHQADPIL